MNRTILLSASAMFLAASAVNAGVLENGEWSPSGCGAFPEAPVIDSNSITAFNQSAAKIGTWQNQIQAYHECMVKEANADSTAINKTATGEQTRINEAVQKVNADAAAGKEKLEKQSSSPSPSLGPMMPSSSMPGGAGY